MLLDQFPQLQQMDPDSRMQLATELWDTAVDEKIFTPEVLAALDERLAYYEAHPEDVFTTEQVMARMEVFKQKLAARRKHG